MFRTISIISFVVTFVGIAVCCVALPCRKECRWSPIEILRRLVHLFTLLFLEQRLSPLGVLRKLVYLLALLCFVILVFTSFYPSLVLDEAISGYLVMLHTSAAGVLSGCLAFLVLVWAHRYRFNESDWPWLVSLIRREAAKKKILSGSSELVQKICFWLIAVLALPVILSIVLSMFVFFGTDAQEFLLNLHRYSALVLALVIIVHTYLIIRNEMKE